MTYCRLSYPISSIRVETAGLHSRIHIWVNGAKSGELVVREDELAAVLCCFQSICTSGKELGHGVFKLADETVLISEHGTLHTWGQIKPVVKS